MSDDQVARVGAALHEALAGEEHRVA
jgi:hypothetical protein